MDQKCRALPNIVQCLGICADSGPRHPARVLGQIRFRETQIWGTIVGSKVPAMRALSRREVLTIVSTCFDPADVFETM